MTMELAPEDVEAIHSTLERFCKQQLGPRVERPEQPLKQAQLGQVCGQLMELGLLNLDDDPGLGLWDAPDSAAAVQLTLGCLRELARCNTGVAFQVHRLALGAHLSRSLGLNTAVPSLPCLQGSWGLGRSALPRLLRGRGLREEDRTLLQDYFLSEQRDSLLVQLGEPCERLLLPSFDGTALLWLSVSREACELQLHEASHGLDELHTATLRVPPAARTQAQPSAGSPAALYARALALDGLGLMALSVGALAHSRDLAADYAELRVQGGETIIGHAAVQQLVGRAAATASAGELLLAGAATATDDDTRLSRVLSARALLHPQCCKAANDALQAFGGIGYMRETGPEKVVRDLNHLRLLNGTPNDLRRFVAEWERPQ